MDLDIDNLHKISIEDVFKMEPADLRRAFVLLQVGYRGLQGSLLIARACHEADLRDKSQPTH